VRNNNLISEELIHISALMSYDRSKTLTEQVSNIREPQQTMPSDRLTPQNYNRILRDFGTYERYEEALQLKAQRERENLIQGYISTIEPKKPYIKQDSIGGTVAQRNESRIFALPYSSNRAKFLLCNTPLGKENNCSCVSPNGRNIPQLPADAETLRGVVNKFEDNPESLTDREQELLNSLQRFTMTFNSSDVKDDYMGPWCKGTKGYRKLEEIYEKDYTEWSSLFGPRAQNEGIHKVLGYAELALTGLGILAGIIFAAPTGGASLSISSILLGTATAVGVTDALLYAQEGDTYSALMMGALTVIPGNELAKAFKAGKKFAGLSDDFLSFLTNSSDEMSQIIKKFKANPKSLTPDELSKLLVFRRATYLNSALITNLLIKYNVKSIKNAIKQLPLGSKILKLLSLGTTVVTVGGLAVGLDTLWMMLNPPDSVKRLMRDTSGVGKLMDFAYENGLTEFAKALGQGVWAMIWGSDGKPNEDGRKDIVDALNMVIDTFEESERVLKELEKRKQDEKNLINNLTAEIQRISGVKNIRPGHDITVGMLKSGAGTIEIGDSGNSTKYIQELLSKIKRKYNDKTYLSVSDVDADFGYITQDAVIDFQFDYVFDPKTEKGKIDGIVGKETINKMEEILKKQNDEQ